MALAAVPEVPGFKALSPLGVGPSSNIYSAHSEQLGRWVALTIYSTSVSDDRDHNRFRRAYELTRRLGVHPHTVTVLDYGISPDRRPYVVTEFYEHGTFDSRVTGNQPLPVDKTLRIGIAVAGALETAHRADVIHGGVHPARILADSDDEPSLAATGLVPLVDPSGAEALLAPMNYHTPPEVLEGDALSPATDVYSLASTLYTLLTARPPYSSSDPEDTSAALLFRVLRHEVPPLGRADVPPSLEHMLRSALHSNPRQRPATVLAFAQSLQAVQQEIGAPVTQPVLLDVAPGLKLVTDAPTPAEPLLAEPAHRPPVAGWQDFQPDPGSHPPQQVFVPYQAPAEPPTGPPPPPEAPTGLATGVAPSPLPARPVFDDVAPPSQPLNERSVAETSLWPPAGGVAQVSRESDRTRREGASPATAGAAGRPGPLARGSDSTGMGRHAAPAQEPVETMPRGPRALPVIVLGVVVLMLLCGAVWMVVSGSDPSDASSTTDPNEQPAD